MHHMRRASVRDLRYHFTDVENLLREGEEIQITKRKQVIAKLVPVRSKGAVQQPDFMGRLKKIYGKKRMKVSAADLISRERDRY